MEVKINREIRNYTEAMFFGLSLRQFIFSLCAVVVAVGVIFPAETIPRYGNRVVGVYFGSRSVCGSRLCQIQRYDRRESDLCVDQV